MSLIVYNSQTPYSSFDCAAGWHAAPQREQREIGEVVMVSKGGQGGVLFTKLKFGRVTLPNRIVMSPMTRSRADENFAPPAMSVTYYTQRASAGLIIAGSTNIHPAVIAMSISPAFTQRPRSTPGER